jgi:hypothetical protein
MLQPGKHILPPLTPEPPKVKKPPLPPAPAKLKDPSKPVLAPVGGKVLGDDACPKCGATCIGKPMPQLRVCSACGHQWPMGPKLHQRPVSRADVMGIPGKFGTPFRY